MRWLERAQRHFPGSMEEHRKTLRRVAQGWMLGGTLLVAFIGAMAAAHYLYDVPMHDQNTGHLSTPENTRKVFLLIGSGGAFFAVMGLILHRAVAQTDRSRFWIGLTSAAILGFVGITVLHSMMP